MIRKQVLPLLLAAVLICLPLTAAAAEVDGGDVYCFSSEDFSQGEENLTGIFVTAIPANTGSVLLGTRVIRPGDVLTVEQMDALTFSAHATEQNATAQMSFLPVFGNQVRTEMTMSLAIRGKENKPPVAEDTTMETYKNLENTGKLKVSDPEGETMTFSVVRQPKRGTVTVGEDGSFTYTPKKNKVGVDSFTFTATDASGKVSREATVTITILKPTESTQYTDTLGSDCRFTAEWMKNTGIFTGETLGGSQCFSPDRAVTRGEFFTMLVKTLDIPVDPDLTATGYEEGVPEWLVPYLAAASRAGLTAAIPRQEVFCPEDNISTGEVAALLCAAMDIEDAVVTSTGENVLWQEAALNALEKVGYELPPAETVTRGQAAQLLYELSRRSETPALQ